MAEPSQSDSASSLLPQDAKFDEQTLKTSVYQWLDALPEIFDSETVDRMSITDDCCPAIMSPSTSRKPALASESTTPTKTSAYSFYREANLASNNVELFLPTNSLPPTIAELSKAINNADNIPYRGKEARNLADLQRDGGQESEIQECLQGLLFPDSTEYGNRLIHINQATFRSQAVPNVSSAQFKISTPIPDCTYGYSASFVDGTFTRAQVNAGRRKSPELWILTRKIYLPFFIIEYKAEGPLNGNLWSATNQIMGAGSTCAALINDLNNIIPRRSDEPNICTGIFGMTASQSLARLWITWWDQGSETFLTKRLGSFALEEEEQLARLKGQIRAIFDWGMGRRLDSIRRGFDRIVEEEEQKEEKKKKEKDKKKDEDDDSSDKEPAKNSARGPKRQRQSIG